MPHALEFDPHSGDYGLGFFGNALEGGAYYVKHESLGAHARRAARPRRARRKRNCRAHAARPPRVAGELCYLCHVYVHANDTRKIVPFDGYRIALFIEPLGLYVTLDIGTITLFPGLLIHISLSTDSDQSLLLTQARSNR